MKTSMVYTDDVRSKSLSIAERRKDDVIWMLEVRGYGALILRGSFIHGTLEFKGISEFSWAEIGWPGH